MSGHKLKIKLKSTIEDTELYRKLRECLIDSEINHKDQIIKQPSLKDVHIYCVIHKISSHQYGALIEHYIIKSNKYIKNKSTECTGDYYDGNYNVELKISLGGKNRNNFNFVQIRPHHNIDYYILTAYHLDAVNILNKGNLYIFKINKNDMIKLLQIYGQYAHGTKTINGEITFESITNVTNVKEYAIRPVFGDKCWNDLIQFRVFEQNI